MRRFTPTHAWIIAFGIAGTQVATEAAPGYLRMPDLHADRLAFVAEGDLWTCDLQGHSPRRITTHVGSEYFPHFSPDGGRIAFTGFYDGNNDVYVVPVEGGEPTRLTWHPSSDEVLGWTSGGKEILFRSRRGHAHGDWMLYTVSSEGGEATLLPLDRASRLSIDPSTGTYAFNVTDRERATWKRYRGGTSQDIWVGDPKRADYRKVTTFPGPDAFPMWHSGRIYFLSDEGGTGNICSILPDGSDRKRHTNETEWDLRWPNMAQDGRIVTMLGGDIFLYDTNTGQSSRITCDLKSELNLTRQRFSQPSEYLTWFDLSPKGDRVAVVTRGEIFCIPVDDGVTIPVSKGSGARESWATFDSKGETLYFVSDASKEEAIHAMDAWGRGDSRVVKPAGTSGWHFAPRPSPDGKWIAYADQTQTLYVVGSAGGTPKKVDRAELDEIDEYEWSPDSRYIAYSKVPRTGFGQIYIYDTKTEKAHEITSATTPSYSPAWDPEGKALYFLSDRTINPFLDFRDFQNVELMNGKPYLVLLKKDGKNPFAKTAGMPESKDGEKKDGDKKDKKKEGDKKGDKKDSDKDDEPVKPIEIDFEGLADRLVEVPVDAGNYGSLAATASHLYWFSHGIHGMNEDDDGEEGPRGSKLIMFDLEEEEEKEFADGITAFDLEAGAGKIALMKKGSDIFVVDAGSPPGEEMGKSKIAFDGIVLEIDPRAEWEQMYFEAWRHQRDFYWNEGMSGIPWAKVRDQYATLLPRLATRDDLADVLGEIIGELATSHTYRWGGDAGVTPRSVGVGLLGAEVVREGDFFKVTRIFRGDAADLDRSPLSEPGVNVREGDYLLALNQKPFEPGLPFEANFQGLAGKTIVLTVNSKAGKAGSRDVVVTPVGNESRLRYIDWVRRNRETVLAKTNGKIGYIHIPDMGTNGMVEFNRWFYPQLDKEGMIVDCRWNGGGFVSQMMLERFRRKIVSFDRSRAGAIFTYPARTLNGPFVVVTNEEAGSDGDIFPHAVQLEKLAPVIGQRSWGGVVGIRGDKNLVDGGSLTEPEFAWWDPVNGWSLENRGVIPDIEVMNLPQDIARGVDAQLDRGIEEVLRLHKEHPPVQANFGPEPNKSREAFREREK